MAAINFRALSALALALPALGGKRSFGPQARLRLSLRLSKAQAAVGPAGPETSLAEELLEEPLIEIMDRSQRPALAARREEPLIELVDRSPAVQDYEGALDDDSMPLVPPNLQEIEGALDDDDTPLVPPGLKAPKPKVLLNINENQVHLEGNQADLDDPLLLQNVEGLGVPSFTNASRQVQPLLNFSRRIDRDVAMAEDLLDVPFLAVGVGALAGTSPGSTAPAVQESLIPSISDAGVWKRMGRTWNSQGPKKHEPVKAAEESEVVPEGFAPDKGSMWDKFSWITGICYVVGVGAPLALIVLGVKEQGDFKEPAVLEAERAERKARMEEFERSRYERVLAREEEAAVA